MKPIYKTVSIKANMNPIMKKVTKTKQIGTKSVKKTKGIFKKEEYIEEMPVFEKYEDMVPTGKYSDIYIDIQEFSNRIMQVCNNLYEEGYDVINISTVINGRYKYDTEWSTDGGAGYGFGYSVTNGVIITAKLRSK